MLAALFLLGCRETMVSSADSQRALPDWNRKLGEIVGPDGRVDYAALEADREPLDRFVAYLAQPRSMRGKKKADRHAFWLNAYNALVLFQVLERGRPASVNDVGGLFPFEGSGFFVETQFPIGEDHLSLSEIFHERLRMKELNYFDHAGAVHGGMSSPALRGELYTRTNLEAQLTEDLEHWIDDPHRGLRVDGDEVVFSPVWKWYARDFTFTSGGERNFCLLAARHAHDRLREDLERIGADGCPHRFMEYDWRLNDTRTPRTTSP